MCRPPCKIVQSVIFICNLEVLTGWMLTCSKFWKTVINCRVEPVELMKLVVLH